MSSVDAAWLGMEDPTNLMMVTGVLVLDGNVDVRRLPAAIGRGVAASQHLLDNPSRIADVARLSTQGAYRLGRLIVLPPDPATAFKGRLGRRKRAAWSTPIPLEDFKAIGTAFGATV